MTVEYVGDGNTDGTSFGQSGEKIAFFGGTPSTQATIATIASAATIATAVAKLQEILAELDSKGLTTLA